MDTVMTLLAILAWILYEIRYPLVAILICLGSWAFDVPPWWTTFAILGCWLASAVTGMFDD